MFCLFRHFSFFPQMVAFFFFFFFLLLSFSPGRNGRVFLMVPCCYFDVIKEYRNLIVPTKEKKKKKEKKKRGGGGGAGKK